MRDEHPLLIDPPPAQWRQWTSRRAPPDAASLETRRALGLPTDRPIIVTGHQTIFWHPGILAKYLAVDAAARSLDAAPAWTAVDHDTDDPWLLRYPSRDNSDRLRAVTLDVRTGGAAPPPSETPACQLPAAPPAAPAPDERPAGPSVRDGLSAIRAALAAHAGEANASRQVQAALVDLLCPLIDPAPTIFASRLASAPAFQRLVRDMDRAPRECVLAYNAAVRTAPHAHLRPLICDEVNERYELPLWRLDAVAGRRRVFAEDLSSIPAEQLAPRALLMTATLRAAACDLMVHGTGGNLYERATDAWFAAWQPQARLAPVAVVTATLHLQLLTHQPPTTRDVARARWLAHHARHDPAPLGDPAASSRRRELVAAIKSARHDGRHPRDAFRALHAFLDGVRAAHAPRLADLSRAADALAVRAADAQVANDRTWPFPLYPRQSLLSLRDDISRRFETRG